MVFDRVELQHRSTAPIEVDDNASERVEKIVDSLILPTMTSGEMVPDKLGDFLACHEVSDATLNRILEAGFSHINLLLKGQIFQNLNWLYQTIFHGKGK